MFDWSPENSNNRGNLCKFRKKKTFFSLLRKTKKNYYSIFLAYLNCHTKWQNKFIKESLLVTNLKILALPANPTVAWHHQNTTMTACMLQMNHDKIFLHWGNGFAKLEGDQNFTIKKLLIPQKLTPYKCQKHD